MSYSAPAMGKKKRREYQSDETPLSSNPFAALAGTLGDLAPAASTPTPDPEPTAPEQASLPLPRRLVVRRQKKGQGGKTATVVEGLSDAHVRELLPALKRELGCSGRTEGEQLLLGTKDHERVAAWLRRAGVRKVVLGN